jgi:hypothetical protein
VCDACLRAKAYQLPYPVSSSHSSSTLALIFSDVWGSTIDSFGRNKYYVSFIDNFSKFTWIYLLRKKSKCLSIFMNFSSLLNASLIGNYCNPIWLGWWVHQIEFLFCNVGISHLVSCPHLHQQNGTVERKHQHIIEMGLALLATFTMPLKYWNDVTPLVSL